MDRRNAITGQDADFIEMLRLINHEIESRTLSELMCCDREAYESIASTEPMEYDMVFDDNTVSFRVKRQKTV